MLWLITLKEHRKFGLNNRIPTILALDLSGRLQTKVPTKMLAAQAYIASAIFIKFTVLYVWYHDSEPHQLLIKNDLKSVIRTSFYNAINNITRKLDEEEIVLYHVEHCVEYLRSSIMCGHGLIIESNSPLGTHPSLVTDPWDKALGWGVTKHCINWENLMSWQRKAYDNHHGL